MADILLLKTERVADTLGGALDVKVCTGSGYNLDGYYEPGIDSDTLGAIVTRQVFANLEDLGAGKTEVGAISLTNVSGVFDDYIRSGFGRDAFFMKGDDTAAVGTFDTLVTGRISHAFDQGDRVLLAWRDRMTELNSFAQQKTYAEGYAGHPTLLAILSDDIAQNKPPRASGKPRYIKPELIDPATRVFAWNHTALGVPTATQSVDGVFLGGVAWELGTAHATLAAFLAATPSQGDYDLYLPLSLIKMGGSLPGNPLSYPLAMNVTIGSTTAANAAPDQLQWWAEDSGVSSGDINASDITALNSAAQFECGIYAGGGDRYIDIMNKLAQSILVVFATDGSGQYRFRQMKPPQGVADKTIRVAGLDKAIKNSEGQIISLRRETRTGLDKAVPVKELAVRYDYNNTRHSEADLDDADIDADMKSYLLEEYRTTAATSDAGMQAKYSNAREVEPFDTILNVKADAETIRDLAFDLWGYPRLSYIAEVVLEGPTKTIEWADELAVFYDDYGFGSGENMIVTTITQTAENKIILGLFE